MSCRYNTRVAIVLVCALFASGAGSKLWADVVELAPDHPDSHAVQKGDTLWDIARRFLAKPWRWPEIWQINPQIKNPHLIYPGDVIRLAYDGDRPYLTLERGTGAGAGAGAGVAGRRPAPGTRQLKLSPQIGVNPREDRERIPTIPLDAVESFLIYPMVVEQADFIQRPYVYAIGARGQELVASLGERAYVRGDLEPGINRFSVYRGAVEEYRDPSRNNERLGYQIRYIGEVELEQRSEDDVYQMRFVSGRNGIKKGDRLYASTLNQIEDSYASFSPRPPKQEVSGHILSLIDGIDYPQEYQVVVLNLGEREGMEPGNVLAIYQQIEPVEDVYAPQDALKFKGQLYEKARLPPLRAGLLMVFRVFPKLSYALILKIENRVVRRGDVVRNPE